MPQTTSQPAPRLTGNARTKEGPSRVCVHPPVTTMVRPEFPQDRSWYNEPPRAQLLPYGKNFTRQKTNSAALERKQPQACGGSGGLAWERNTPKTAVVRAFRTKYYGGIWGEGNKSIISNSRPLLPPLACSVVMLLTSDPKVQTHFPSHTVLQTSGDFTEGHFHPFLPPPVHTIGLK